MPCSVCRRTAVFAITSVFLGSCAYADVFSMGTTLKSVELVPVGNAGNPGDTRWPNGPHGGVPYDFSIGKYEITAGQYTEFLNAVAKTDTYGLYNTLMAYDDIMSKWACNIRRSGASGSYVYTVASDWANRPVNYVSWGDAARFCNLLTNGQPTGAQGLSTTEDGSYYLNGATTAAALMAVTRKTPAQGGLYYIPTENEWFKAAYHKNDGVTGNYWTYPTVSDSQPSNLLTSPDPGNNVNYWNPSPTIG
ncbi:MAG: SUMF1/EgtB/PvdO family nonheme iron enzyme [Phycisphaerae bacterium]